MRNLRTPLIFLAVGGVLAGCQSTNPGFPGTNSPPPPTQPTAPGPVVAIDGTWIPTDEAAKGVYVATFKGGVFVSKSPSSGKILAKGSYTIPSSTKVALKFEGAATKTVVDADCDLRTATTLYCVPSIGSPFNLQKTT